MNVMLIGSKYIADSIRLFEYPLGTLSEYNPHIKCYRVEHMCCLVSFCLLMFSLPFREWFKNKHIKHNILYITLILADEDKINALVDMPSK